MMAQDTLVKYLIDEGIGAQETKNKICGYFKANKLKVREISSGARHLLVVCDNKELYTFGNNNYGQCGKSQNQTKHSAWDPDAIKSTFIDEPYLLQIGGDDEHAEQVSCGYDHSLVLTNWNRVYVFGDNATGQCSCVLKDGIVSKPYCLDKVKELKLKETSYIDRVLGFTEESIIMVNPNKIDRVYE